MISGDLSGLGSMGADPHVRDFIDWLRDRGAVIVKLGPLDVTFAAPKAIPRDPAEDKLSTEAQMKSDIQVHAERWGLSADDFPVVR